MIPDRDTLVARVRTAQAAGHSLRKIAIAAGVDRSNLSSFLSKGVNFGPASQAKLAAALDRIEAEMMVNGTIS